MVGLSNSPPSVGNIAAISCSDQIHPQPHREASCESLPTYEADNVRTNLLTLILPWPDYPQPSTVRHKLLPRRILSFELTISSEPVTIAIIGGTGLGQLEGYEPVALLNPTTPWGEAASPIHILSHNGTHVAFLARHGIHHQFAPHEVPNRANIAALRSIGVRCIVAFSAVGSLQEEIKPMDFVLPDQVIDRTKGIRPFTFFEGGVVGHVGYSDPFDSKLADVVKTCAASMEGDGVVLHDKGTLICMGM